MCGLTAHTVFLEYYLEIAFDPSLQNKNDYHRWYRIQGFTRLSYLKADKLPRFNSHKYVTIN